MQTEFQQWHRLYLIALLLLAIGACDDGQGGAIEVLCEGAEQCAEFFDLGPDTKPPKEVAPSPYKPCLLQLTEPTADIHVGGPGSELTISGQAVHPNPDLDMDKVIAVLNYKTDDPNKKQVINLGEIPSNQWLDNSFDWKTDISILESGTWCVQLSALSESNDEALEGASCFTETCIFIDNSCPNLKVMKPFEPSDGTEPVEEDDDPLKGYYSGEMHTRVVAQDQTAIETIIITDSAGKKLSVNELAEGGTEIQVVDEILDVCNYGSGEASFTITATDTLGNSCSDSKTPFIVHCPQFISSEEYLIEEFTPNFIESVDFNLEGDGDGLTDILVATSGGVMIYRNDGDGALKDAKFLPDLEGISATFVHAVNLNNDDLTDLIVVSESDGVVNIYIQSDKVCEPDEEFIPAETDDPKMDYPTVCHHGFGLAQSIPTPSQVTATHMAQLSDDLTPLGENTPQKDLVIATKKGAYALGVLVSAEGGIGWESPQLDENGVAVKDENGDVVIEQHSASRCSYFEKRWTYEKEDKEPLEHEKKALCFYPPKWTASAGGIVDLDSGDYMTLDQAQKTDIIAVWKNSVSVFKNDGNNNFDIAFTEPLSGGKFDDPLPTLARVIPGYFDPDEHLDALVLLSDRNQIWTIFGEGNGKWRRTIDAELGFMVTQRRSTCMEGLISDAALHFLDDFDTPQNQTLDIVLANKNDGTMWSMKGNGIPSSGTHFSKPQIVNALPNPEQLILAKINDDEFLDVVLLSPTSSRIAVIYGSNNTLPKSNSKYGKKGTFVGAENLTTLIPEQNFGAIMHCGGSTIKVANQTEPYKEWSTWQGKPEQRLTPQFIEVGDFVGPDTNIDLVMLTERTGVFEGMDTSGKNPKLGDARTVLYTYKSDGSSPRSYHGRTFVAAPTSYCIDKLIPVPTDPDEAASFEPDDPKNYECPSTGGPTKGPETGIVKGTFDQGLSVDLVLSTNTPLDGDVELTTVDILLNKYDGKFEQVEVFPSKNGELTEKAWPTGPGEWQDLGFSACSKPRAMQALYCDGPNDNLADFAVICSLELGGGISLDTLKVYQSQGTGDKYNVKNIVAVQGGKSIQSTRLGNPFGPDLFVDLLLMKENNVVTFESTGFCNFAPTFTEVTMGPGLVSMATGDLNGDGYTDLVTPLKNGSIAVAMGFNAIGFEAPSHQLETESSGLGQSSVADINGDGALDILVVDKSNSGIISFMNIGDGSFWPKPYRIRTGAAPSEFKVVDFNQDDCLDIAALSPTAKAASIIMSRVGENGECIPTL